MPKSFTHGENNCDTHLGIEIQMCYKMDKSYTYPMDSKFDFKIN